MIDFASWNRRERAARWSRHTLYLFLRFSAPLYLDGASILSLLQANAVTLTSTHHLPYLDINLPCYLCYTHVLLCTIRTTRPMAMPCLLPCLLHLAPCFVAFVLRNTPTVPFIRVLLRMSVTLYSHHLPALPLLHRGSSVSIETASYATTRHDLRCTKKKPHDRCPRYFACVRYSCLISVVLPGCDKSKVKVTPPYLVLV